MHASSVFFLIGMMAVIYQVPFYAGQAESVIRKDEKCVCKMCQGNKSYPHLLCADRAKKVVSAFRPLALSSHSQSKSSSPLIKIVLAYWNIMQEIPWISMFPLEGELILDSVYPHSARSPGSPKLYEGDYVVPRVMSKKLDKKEDSSIFVGSTQPFINEDTEFGKIDCQNLTLFLDGDLSEPSGQSYPKKKYELISRDGNYKVEVSKPSKESISKFERYCSWSAILEHYIFVNSEGSAKNMYRSLSKTIQI